MYRQNEFYYDQPGTSQDNYQQQGWYQDQSYAQYYSGNTPQANYPQQYPYQHQFSRSSKRPHEFTLPGVTGSPEAKRILQKNGQLDNMQVQRIKFKQQLQNYQSASQQAAYQTVAHQKPFERKFQNVPKKKPPQQPQVNPVIKIQEERQKDWQEKMEKTLELLKVCKPGEEVQLLLSNLQPPRATWNKIKETIHNDIMKFLGPMGSVEKVLIFGSTLTGLDFHGSDLDFYIQLRNQPTNEDEIRITINKAAKLSRFLYRSDFMMICTIQSARVPLIRLLHKKSKVTCDINFSSQFGYYNSYFIAHLIGYDRRIRDLAVILKLWSKSYKLASQMTITNYCLMMLMIFYLQNLKDPMLDKIINVQRNRSPMVLDAQKKWNFYFNESIDKTKNNCQSVRELLSGFFEFFGALNPSEYVVSLLTGTLIKREVFNTCQELEASRSLISRCGLQNLKCDNADFFHVQDGFELNLNIGIKVKKHVEYFFELLKQSHQKCEELKDRPFSELLVKLFTDIKMPTSALEGKSKKQKNKKKFEMIIHAVPGDLKVNMIIILFKQSFSFGFPQLLFPQQCQDILLAQNPNKLLTPDDQQKFYFNHAVEITKKFLQEIYLCMIVPEINETSANPFLTRFKIILHVDTINGRKKIGFKDEGAIKAEQELSRKMAEKKVPFELDALMIISSKDMGKTVEFEILDENSPGKSTLLNFGNYFSINILPALRYYLKKKLDNIGTL